jgi:hypothetical protein
MRLVRGAAYTRREALRLGGLGAIALAAPPLLRPNVARAAADIAPAWRLDDDVVTRAPFWETDEEQVLWTTVMRVDTKLATPEARWYLWHSTHDTPILRRYTAPSITGPWTERAPCVLPEMPSPWENDHRQCPDIGWDPVGRRFIASIHSLTYSPRLMQNTFMLQSRDGVTWSLMSNAPAVPIGTRTAFDGYAIDYGRFLRDPDGNLVRVNGLYHWYFRGTRKVVDYTTGPDVEAYEVGVATSPDLVNWTKKSSSVLNPGSERMFAIGSAVWLNGIANLIWTVCPAGGSPQVYLQKSGPFAPASFPQQGPGVPIYSDAVVATDGPSFAVEYGEQFMTFGAAKSLWFDGMPKTTANQYAIRLLRAAL